MRRNEGEVIKSRIPVSGTGEDSITRTFVRCLTLAHAYTVLNMKCTLHITQ